MIQTNICLLNIQSMAIYILKALIALMGSLGLHRCMLWLFSYVRIPSVSVVCNIERRKWNKIISLIVSKTYEGIHENCGNSD